MKSYNPEAKVHINCKEKQERTWGGCVSGKFVNHLDSQTGSDGVRRVAWNLRDFRLQYTTAAIFLVMLQTGFDFTVCTIDTLPIIIWLTGNRQVATNVNASSAFYLPSKFDKSMSWYLCIHYNWVPIIFEPRTVQLADLVCSISMGLNVRYRHPACRETLLAS